MMAFDVGKFLLAGFSGQTCTQDSHVFQLIVKQRVCALLIKPENFQSGSQLKKLISDIQALALYEGFERPVLICVDSELGSMNIFYDDPIISKFPCEMALSATRDLELIRKVGEITAIQWKSIGVNMYIGPILDICEKNIDKVIGIHSFGTNADQVTEFAGAFCEGLKQGGILVCAKHFPGTGNGVFDELNETLTILDNEQTIMSNSVIPYRDLILQGNIDAVTIANASYPNVSESDYLAFVSPKIVEGILRNKLEFTGVAIAECLETDIIYITWGLGQLASISILYAGCDLVTVCTSYDNQCEVLKYLKMAFADDSRELILLACMSRINNLTKSLSWDKLNFDLPSDLINEYRQLCDSTYGKTISLARDFENVIPLTNYIMNKRMEYQGLEFLNPNLPPYKFVKIAVLSPSVKDLNITGSHNCENINKSELDVTFKEFVNYLSSYSLLHTYHVNQVEYGSHGLTLEQENIIADSDLIIFISVDARVNSYQLGIAKKLAIIIEHLKDKMNALSKQMILLSTGSPYELNSPAPMAAAFICCYDYSFFAFRNVCKLLFGDLQPQGRILNNHTNKNIVSFDSINENWDFGGLLNKQPSAAGDVNDTLNDINDTNGNKFLPEFIGTQSLKKESTNNINDVEHDRIRPWVVEQFDFHKDALQVFALSKTDSVNELLDGIDGHTLHRIEQVYADCEGDLKTFIIKNSSTGLIHGFMVTYFDSFTRTGQILYMVVSKWKRRLQIGEALHKHTIRYFTIEKRCRSVSLGCVFPLVLLFPPLVIEEFKKVWKFLEIGGPELKIETLTNSFQFIEFFRSTGWGSSKHGFLQQERHIMKLDVGEDWCLPGTRQIIPYEGQQVPPMLNFNSSSDFMNSIQYYGIKFKLLDNDTYPQMILNEYIVRSELSDEEEVKFPKIYKFAAKYKSEEIMGKRATIILGAFIGDVPIGSLVIYSKSSSIANFYPLLDKVGRFEENACGLTAICVAHEDTLKSVNNGILIDKTLIKMALITTGVQIVRSLHIKHVILHNIAVDKLCLYQAIGFQTHRVYCALFGRKKAFEWVL